MNTTTTYWTPCVAVRAFSTSRSWHDRRNPKRSQTHIHRVALCLALNSAVVWGTLCVSEYQPDITYKECMYKNREPNCTNLTFTKICAACVCVGDCFQEVHIVIVQCLDHCINDGQVSIKFAAVASWELSLRSSSTLCARFAYLIDVSVMSKWAPFICPDR